MTKTVKRIAPLQLGKILGVLYGVVSLIFVPFFLLAAVIGAFAPKAENNPGDAISIGLCVAMAIFMPIIYGAMGFITGLIGGWLYNVVAARIGGIEVEIE